MDNEMDKLKKVLKERLEEAFGEDKQDVVAERIFSTQPTVSKWITGESIPKIDSLVSIAKEYKVSLDWLVGLSDEKYVDSVAFQKLTYVETALIVDRLLELGVIQIPDLNSINNENNVSGEERYDPDYLKINDRVLSFILRRRYQIYKIGPDMIGTWTDTSLPRYDGLRLLRYTKEIDKYIGHMNWVGYGDAEWAALVRKIEKMTEEEILIELEKLEKKKEEEKDGD